jgi:hypothetical protein
LAGDNGRLAARIAGRKTCVAFGVFIALVMSTIQMGFVKVPVNFSKLSTRQERKHSG